MPAAPGPAIVVTASDNWHPGIVGLLASRLKEHARRPAFAIAFNPNGVGTGSGRSVAGFDLGRLVREAADEGLIVKGGGHAMAAGITVERDKLGALRAFFEERAAADVFRLQDEESLEIDAALAAEGATHGLLDALEKAGPFGAGPCRAGLRAAAARLADARPVGTSHIRADLRSDGGGRIQAIAFRAVGHGARRLPVQATAARTSMSPDRCRATTGTATAPCSSASIDAALA